MADEAWQRIIDPSTGCAYLYNAATGESRWEELAAEEPEIAREHVAKPAEPEAATTPNEVPFETVQQPRSSGKTAAPEMTFEMVNPMARRRLRAEATKLEEEKRIADAEDEEEEPEDITDRAEGHIEKSEATLESEAPEGAAAGRAPSVTGPSSLLRRSRQRTGSRRRRRGLPRGYPEGADRQGRGRGDDAADCHVEIPFGRIGPSREVRRGRVAATRGADVDSEGADQPLAALGERTAGEGRFAAT